MGAYRRAMHAARLGGYTLVEAVVTLAVLATLGGLAVPPLADMIQAQRLGAVANDVLQQITLARSEAIKRNTRVALCKSADGTTCADRGGWEQGWILFQDRNNNGLREDHEPLLEALRPLPRDFRLTANSPLARYVSYGPEGGSHLVSGAFQAGTFTVCRASAGKAEGRQIIVNSGGRPRMQKVQLAQCL